MLAGLAAAALVAAGAVGAADDERLLAANGLAMRAPAGWTRVATALAGNVSDPRTALVVGTRGVVARDSECQVAAYQIPTDGAAVVVLAWRAAANGLPRDRSQLAGLHLKRPIFECWDGRGAVAQIALKGRGYQVNVLVGDRASRTTIAEALAVARSFAVAD